jgi:hypothetical protein
MLPSHRRTPRRELVDRKGWPKLHDGGRSRRHVAVQCRVDY